MCVRMFFQDVGPVRQTMTEGFNLAARFIIHTVGPKYKAKYRTAAESSSLQLLQKRHAAFQVRRMLPTNLVRLLHKY